MSSSGHNRLLNRRTRIMDCKYMSFWSLSFPSRSLTFISFLDHIYISFQDKQLKPDSARNIEAEILARHKKKQREAAKEGRRPFYLKKCNFSLPSSSFYLPLLTFEFQYVRNAISAYVHFISLFYHFPFARVRKNRF